MSDLWQTELLAYCDDARWPCCFWHSFTEINTLKKWNKPLEIAWQPPRRFLRGVMDGASPSQHAFFSSLPWRLAGEGTLWGSMLGWRSFEAEVSNLLCETRVKLSSCQRSKDNVKMLAAPRPVVQTTYQRLSLQEGNNTPGWCSSSVPSTQQQHASLSRLRLLNSNTRFTLMAHPLWSHKAAI